MFELKIRGSFISALTNEKLRNEINASSKKTFEVFIFIGFNFFQC